MALSSEIRPSKNLRDNRIRLLITCDCSGEFPSRIPHQRLVYGFDPNLATTVNEILAHLRQKFFPGVDEIILELHLRRPGEYFIPAWSRVKDVLRNDDEVILRVFRAASKETAELVQEETASPSNQRKKRKRAREKAPIFESKFDSILSNDAVELDDDAGVAKDGERRKKKKKNAKPDDSESSFIPFKKSPTKSKSKEIRNVDVSQDADKNLSNDRSSKKKNLYDAAVVIRNGDTGKIQHVYFDSSSSSDVEEEIAPKRRETIDGGTERVTSSVLAKAKAFTVSIDERTTCGALDTAVRSQINGDSIDGSVSNGVPVVVTKRLDRQRKKGPRSGGHYSNTSLIVQKAARNNLGTPSSNGHEDASRKETLLIANQLSLSPVLAASKSPLAVDPDVVSALAVNGILSSPPSWKPMRAVEEYPMVKYAGAVRPGDRFAYKVMELNVLDCTPGISDWKIGELLAFDAEELELRVKLLCGEARCDVPHKFRLDFTGNEETGDHVDDEHQQPSQEDVVRWSEIVEARLLNE